MAMTEPSGAWAVELLVDQARDAIKDGRYQQAVVAASRAVAAAEQLDDPNLLAQALEREATALRMLGEFATALTRYTRVLGLAEDPATSHRLDQPATARAVAGAYMDWVTTARFLTGIPQRKLFEVLDAADR
jgi:tetratricopeptide (TPR) repeat protein